MKAFKTLAAAGECVLFADYVTLSAYPNASRQSRKMRRSKRLWDKLLIAQVVCRVR